MANSRRTLYVGVTNDLERRVYEHKHKLVRGYTSKYNLTKLVCYEVLPTMRDAITREKQIKGWLRTKKIEANNPYWHDLAANWKARDPSQAQDDETHGASLEANL